MKIPVLLLALAVTSRAEGESSVVRFSNGDQLTGELVSLTGEGLTWRSQLLKEPAEFALKHVLDLSLPVGAPPADRPAVAHEAILEMTNGDSIRGQLAGINDSEIRLSTWYAGEIAVRRVNVKSVQISSVSDIHYRGPNSIEEWTQGDGGDSWTFRGGALLAASPGGIAREIDFPEESVVAFDASWRGAFRPKIVLFSDDVGTSNPQAGYEMVFQGNSVYVKKAGSNNWLGHSTNAGVLREIEKARIEIKVSLKSGKIALFVDGAIIDIWQDDAIDRESLGKGFHFVSQDSSQLKVWNIEVAGWDGHLEEAPNRRFQLHARRFEGGGFEIDDFGGTPEPKKEEEIPEGRMVLRNGDTIEGEVLSVKGEEITLKTPFAEVSFPVARLKNIALSGKNLETPKLYNGDVRATMADGSRFVFRLDAVEDDALVGFSQNFGTARFGKGAFKRIEFNIHPKPGAETPRFRDDW